MNFVKFKFWIAAAVAMTSVSAFAQTFPNKPIRLIVPVAPGGILDQVSRMVATPMGAELGQPVIVDNRAGGSGNIGATAVARSAPDGYNVLVGYSMFHVGNPAMFSTLEWDPIRDFKSVALLVVSPHIVAVHPSVPVNSLQELVDYAKANPGKLNYSSPGTGSVPHVGMELFKQNVDIDIVHIPYKGAGPGVKDAAAGVVEVTVATPPSLKPFIDGGMLKPLAIAAPERNSAFPDVPTTAEAGFPGFELEAWVAFFVPKQTPDSVAEKLSQATQAALKDPKAETALKNLGLEIRYLPPKDLDALVEKDINYWQPVIRKSNIRID
jgi:tripartite-type tricarboxylate transporter receptor subunit TctC